MKKYIAPLSILTLAIIFFSIRVIFLKPRILVYPDKPDFLHFEFVKINLKIQPHDSILKNQLGDEVSMYVVKYDSITKVESEPVVTIGSKKLFLLKYNPESRSYSVNWPVPWNAENCTYKPVIKFPDKIRQNRKIKIICSSFNIKNRKPPSIYRLTGLSCLGVLTFENINPIDGLSMKKPDDSITDWRGLVDWAKFVNANAFWMLGGSTIYYDKKLKEEFPWIEYNLGKLGKVGREFHKNNIKFGVWAVGYLTFGNQVHAPKKYKYAVSYENGKLETTRSISLLDENRIADLINFYKKLDKIPEIDFYGIDYIRNALGGYELVDEFIKDMEIPVPEKFREKSFSGRMIWLARKKVERKDKPFIDQWQWWRAHKSASNVYRIIKGANIKKPFFAYTLSWDKGWQHGQDPIMMSDAGVDIDAIMLYECDRAQYEGLVKKWNDYKIKHWQSNIIAGDVVDWPLHQFTTNPTGPQELYYRTITAVKKFYCDEPLKGVFIHDLSRALWGRTGQYSGKDWLLAGKEAINTMVQLNTARRKKGKMK